MKTGFITTMLLLFAAGMAQAQDNQAKIDGNPNVNTIVVNTTGDVTIYQGDKFAVKWSDETVHYNMNFELKDSVAYLSGSDDFEVTMPMLKYLEVNSAGDVVARDGIVAKNISICSNGSGNVDLNLICSNIYLRNNGSGDVTLRGNANALMIETKGKGTNNAVKLKHSVSIINGYGQKDDELAVLKVLNGTVNQHTPNSEGWLYETRQFAEFMDATLSWTCQRCAAFTFERVGNEWALKGVENIPQEPENARLMRSAAPFFNQEQHRNRIVHETEGRTQDNQAKIDGNPNVNTIVVNTTGDVTIYQGDKFAVKWDNETVHYNMNFELKDSVAYLSGSDDFEVTMPMLKYLEVNSSGDVVARDALKGENLSICNSASGDIDLNLMYSNIYLKSNGSGDVTLRGNANALMVESFGSGDFNAVKLNHSVSFVNATGSGEGDLGKVRDMVFVHNSNHDASQILDNCGTATSLGSPIRFEKDYPNWRIKGYEHIKINDDVAVVLNAAAPFFYQEQLRNGSTFGLDGMVKTIENDSAKTDREQLDEDLGNLVKDITQGMVKGKRENWSEEQWNDWSDSLDLRFKEYEMEAKKFELEAKKFEKEAKEFEKNMQENVQETKKGSHFLEPNWASFGIGLNMLLTPSLNQDFDEGYEFLEQRPMKSLYFEVNCFGAGVAFDRNHKSGIFTGFGFSFNRFFFKNPIVLVNDPNQLSASWIDEDQYKMRKSRLVTMYFNVPLMLEFNPTRDFCIEAGVTGGIRLFAVNKAYYEYKNVEQLIPDASRRNRGFRERDFGRYSTSLFSLEGSLRVTYDDFGIFVNYDILPVFDTNKAPDLHALSFGFTFVF